MDKAFSNSFIWPLYGSCGVIETVSPEFAPFDWKKSCIRETKHLSTDADSSTDAIGGWHTPPLRGTEPGPNSREALSHQLKKRGSQDVRDISKTEKVSYNDLMDDPWCPSDRSWTKDSMGDVFKVLSISEPSRNVSWSRQTFQITEEHVKSWFPLNMECFKVHQLFEHEGYIVLKYITVDPAKKIRI